MRTTPLVLALVATLLAFPARAEWTKLAMQTSADDYLMSVDVISDLQFVTGGMALDQSSGFPLPKTVFYRTQDGGQLLQPIQVGAGGFSAAAVMDLAFLSLANGWAALGGDVWRTTNGLNFQKATLTADGSVNALARLDVNAGVAVGSGGGAWRTIDGGATWAPVETGTTADLACVHFVDGQRGWAAGALEVEVLDGYTTNGDNVVLSTTDGGGSWKVAATFAKAETDGEGGRVSCPIFFLPDGRTGWLVQSLYDSEKQRAKDLKLLRTADGGATWRDLGVDVKVGLLKMMAWEIPINMSYAAGMYWTDDGMHGRVSGAADTGMSASGGGGGDTPVYRLVDLVTHDGGTTWTKPDYGEITMDISGGQAPAGDPRPMKATFKGWYQAVMVGEKGTIWRMGAGCKKTSECMDGYECVDPNPDPKVTGDSRCVPKAGGPDGTGEGIGDRDAVTGTDGSGEGTSPTLDIPPCEGDDCPSGKGGGGCTGGAIPVGPGAWPAAILMVAFWVAARRSRT